MKKSIAIILALAVALTGCAAQPPNRERADILAFESYEQRARACNGAMIQPRTGTRIRRGPAADELLRARCAQ